MALEYNNSEVIIPDKYDPAQDITLDHFTNPDWFRSMLDHYGFQGAVRIADKFSACSTRQYLAKNSKKSIKMTTHDYDAWDFPDEKDFTPEDIEKSKWVEEKLLLLWKSGIISEEDLSGDERFYRELQKLKKLKNFDKLTPVDIKILATDPTHTSISRPILDVYNLRSKHPESFKDRTPIDIRKYNSSFPQDPARCTIIDDGEGGYVLWRALKDGVVVHPGKPQKAEDGFWSGWYIWTESGKPTEPMQILNETFDNAWITGIDISQIRKEKRKFQRKITNGVDINEMKFPGEEIKGNGKKKSKKA
jgi:hypothetical protein